ncbi:MAG: penicillin acylase family protein [Aurantibacter sp.]
MKILKKIGWVLVAILGILALTAGVFTYSVSPDYDGERTLTGLSNPVNVHYDTYGIPHIYAENEKDAIRALGYVHAQDRLWQMELLRRVGRGGLSEVFGADLIETDKMFLSLGIDEATERTLADLDTDGQMVQLSNAYLDGINQFIEEGPTPVEFYLTGREKTPFKLKDVYNAVGYMAFSFAMAHKTDPLLTNIKDKLGVEYLMDLALDVGPRSVLIKNNPEMPYDSIANNLTTFAAKAIDKLPLPQFEGSNSWVISPAKTKNGKVIFANDPHIGFAQPSVWYEAHVATPTYEKYGYHLAGVPFPLLGHDRNLAYGLTMFENDDIDFYYEEVDPNDSTKYKTENGWESFQNITKTIKVKDGADVVFKYKKTRHGPIVNQVMGGVSQNRPVAMSWIYTQMENKVMDAVYGISMATNLEEFKSALPNIHAPGLNVMYGDAAGNVGWFASAKLYRMPDSVHRKLILDGTSGRDERLRYLDFSENPQAVNPPWNYVYSANNQPDSISGMLYPGYYLPENRAKRITQLLETKNDWDLKSATEMITDVTSAVNPEILKNLENALDIDQMADVQISALNKLRNWDGEYNLENTEGALFHRWIYFILKNTLEDELGQELFAQIMSTHLLKRMIAPLSANDTSIWWDNIKTGNVKETRQDIVRKSFDAAYESLEKDFGNDASKWTWNKVHTLEHGHPMGQVEALREYFNVGPFPVAGSREVINNLGFSYSGDGFYKVGSGPSTRRVIDFSDVENSLSILPTGQSGNPLSPHYKDQAEMYVKGEFRKMLMNKEEIETTSKSLLIFSPN